MPLKLYHKKRNFEKTKEPRGREHKTGKRRFVVQEHHATRLHFDFRLEMEGVMKSWAVPKGPSLDPTDKRLAVMVEDHPIEYNSFQGTIPAGSYGAGEVRRWDFGTYEPIGDVPIEKQLAAGKLTLILKGKQLKGEFHMIKMEGRGENNWLLFKHQDEYADPDWDLKQLLPYGSRADAEKKEKKKVGAKALEELVTKSRVKRKVVKKRAASKLKRTVSRAKRVTTKAKRVAPKTKKKKAASS